MSRNKCETEESLVLPVGVKCSVNIAKYSYKPLPNESEAEISAKSYTDKYDAITSEVIYDFAMKKAKLSLNHKLGYSFMVSSLDVVYDFGKFKLTEDKITCIGDSALYTISIQDVPRHIFYPQFNCVIEYKLKSCPGSFNIEFNFDIPYFQKLTPISFLKSEGYEIPEEIEDLFPDEKKVLEYVNSLDLEMHEKLSYAIYIEDLESQKEMLPKKLLNITVSYARHDYELNSDIYRFEVPENSKKFLPTPTNILESAIQFIPMAKSELMEKRKRRITYAIENMSDDNEGRTWIEFAVSSHAKSSLDSNIRYEVRFIPNNIGFQAAIKALKNIKEKSLEDYFDNFCINLGNKDEQDAPYTRKFKWFNKNINSNEEQKLAIKNIVNRTSFPFPFCIFGPPGTGKTSCLVECVLQILKIKPNSKILVTAQSNSACNEIGERLIKFTSIKNVFRLYSARLQVSNPAALSENLLPSSNLRGKKNVLPSMEELKHFPIIISTLITASQLDRASLQNYFDYIFIDECAATTEPEACIPVVELGCDKDSKVTASIVLIGDPKQLPPVISSSIAIKLGLNVSLMERVMTTLHYKANPNYDSNYIVQLLDNYRSHPAILQFSNDTFYGGKLRAKNKSDEVMSGLNWKELPNRHFPVMFHNEICQSEIDSNGKSSYNVGEIDIVKAYVNDLLKNGLKSKKISPEDIGVVTPYKAQADMLKNVLPKEVEVGTTEYYQGREKLIMIISTVKSKTGVGFLANKRRLNVCMTRAKALMIIVGNADTLEQNSLWRRFVKYCKENYAFRNNRAVTYSFKNAPITQI